MNRGSLVRRDRGAQATGRFNEAPIHESGKSVPPAVFAVIVAPLQ